MQPDSQTKRRPVTLTAKHLRRGACIAVTAAAVLTLAGSAPMDRGEVEFEEVEVFIEINATDGDAGLQIFLDGDAWEKVIMRHPDGRVLLNVKATGEVRDQSLTEMFFESSEPSFKKQPLKEFLERFPEGEYTFRGRGSDGTHLFGSALLTHALPDEPVILHPEEDDVLDPDEIFVAWEPVPDPPGSEIVGYQIIVEQDEGPLRVFSVDLPADQFEVSVPPEFFELDTEYKVEVIARETSGNQTISELSFTTSD